MPNLKRINIDSKLELDVWLSKHADSEESVMLVTHTDVSHRKYVSREQIGEVLTKHGWKVSSRSTLGAANLLGHVITKLEH